MKCDLLFGRAGCRIDNYVPKLPSEPNAVTTAECKPDSVLHKKEYLDTSDPNPANHVTRLATPYPRSEDPDPEATRRKNPWIFRVDNNDYPFKRGCFLSSKPNPTATTIYDFKNAAPNLGPGDIEISSNSTEPTPPPVSSNVIIYTGNEVIVPPEAQQKPSSSKNWLQFFLVLAILAIGTAIITWLICGGSCKERTEDVDKRRNAALKKIKLWLKSTGSILRSGSDKKSRKHKKSKFSKDADKTKKSGKNKPNMDESRAMLFESVAPGDDNLGLEFHKNMGRQIGSGSPKSRPMTTSLSNKKGRNVSHKFDKVSDLPREV
jgi:hypothetical protein